MGRLVFMLDHVLSTLMGREIRMTGHTGVFRHLSGVGVALLVVLAADHAAGGTLPLDRLGSDRPDLRAPAVLRVQTGQRLNRAPSIFHGMMLPSFRRNSDCRSAEDIHDRLKRQGWWDFQNLERVGEHFTIGARRPNGTAYLLTIDGCSGRVLEAKRVEGAGRGYRLWPR